MAVLREWRNDPANYRWFRQNDFINDLTQAAWYEKIAKDPAIAMYKVTASSTDRPESMVGVVGLTGISYVYRRAEISIMVPQRLQGRGVGSSALHLLVSHAFTNVGLHSLHAEVLAENPAAVRFEKLGFTYEGLRRDFYFKEGKWEAAKLYSILEHEWAVLGPKLRSSLSLA